MAKSERTSTMSEAASNAPRVATIIQIPTPYNSAALRTARAEAETAARAELDTDAQRVACEAEALLALSRRALLALVRTDPERFEAFAHAAEALADRLIDCDALGEFADSIIVTAACMVALVLRNDAAELDDWLRTGDEFDALEAAA